MRPNTHALNVGDVVVMHGAVGGPAMRLVGFGHANTGTCQGATAKLESLRPGENDPLKPAWLAEFLVDGLRVLPGGHYATKSPFYDFGGV